MWFVRDPVTAFIKSNVKRKYFNTWWGYGFI